MTIRMKDIGTVLDSRPAGREALLAMRPQINGAEVLVLDFAGVQVLTPSFADEFVTPLAKEHPNRLRLTNTWENITVRKTVEFLSDDWQEKVTIEKRPH